MIPDSVRPRDGSPSLPSTQAPTPLPNVLTARDGGSRPRDPGVPGMAWIWLLVGNGLAFVSGMMIVRDRIGWQWWVTWTIIAFAVFTLRAGQRIR